MRIESATSVTDFDRVPKGETKVTKTRNYTTGEVGGRCGEGKKGEGGNKGNGNGGNRKWGEGRNGTKLWRARENLSRASH